MVSQMPHLQRFGGNEEQSWEINWKRNPKSATTGRKGNYTSCLIQVIFSPGKWEGWADQRASDTSPNTPPAPWARVLLHSPWGTDFSQLKWHIQMLPGHVPTLQKHHHSQEGDNTKHWLKEMTLRRFWGQQVKGGDCCPLLSTGEAPGPVLGSKAHNWHGSTGISPREGLWELKDERFLCTMRGWGCWNCLSGEQRLGMILHV